ncbi:xylose repressor [Alicyclobacillus hesperidum subsp. aegles]|uniref:ROK family protein n=1 Tax=Alicyclobacillus hesperidum TaxID=89784 RepID=UPI00222A3FC0|nr:ROK family protein [Alicyclobacillus hesperidum]GLG01405.1 xylose repressor [Alicyclobacillus hesperidum subsp. aegles]
MHANIDASAMRRMNRATVLKLIRDLRTTSRIDISQMTGLNKATVSNIVDELISEQLVLEVGYGSSSGGRKPILLRFNANAAYAVGVDVQISHMTTVVCNIRGEPVYRQVRQTPLASSGDPRDQLLDHIADEVSKAVAAAPSSPYGLVGACIALPGMVNFHRGLVYYLPSLFAGEWDIRSQLAERVSIPLFFDNDANCGAWNEYMGQAMRLKNLVFVNMGIGIGAGIVIDGRLYRGRDGIAGELGHMTVNPMGSACMCGSYGCWEEYASERGLLRYLREAGADVSTVGVGESLLEQAITQAQNDNRAFIRAFHALGQQLGIGIANILNVLNPDEVILGGSVVKAATFVLPEVERAIKHRALLTNKQVPVRMGNVHAVAVGASSLVMHEILFASAEPAAP